MQNLSQTLIPLRTLVTERLVPSVRAASPSGEVEVSRSMRLGGS